MFSGQLCSLRKVLSGPRRFVPLRHCRVANSNHIVDAVMATVATQDREESIVDDWIVVVYDCVARVTVS